MTEGNLWTYILSVAKEGEVQNREVSKMIFERFGFLPNDLMVRSVMFRLRNDGYISKEKLKGERAYRITEKGKKELGAMKSFCQDLLQKI